MPGLRRAARTGLTKPIVLDLGRQWGTARADDLGTGGPRCGVHRRGSWRRPPPSLQPRCRDMSPGPCLATDLAAPTAAPRSPGDAFAGEGGDAGRRRAVGMPCRRLSCSAHAGHFVSGRSAAVLDGLPNRSTPAQTRADRAPHLDGSARPRSACRPPEDGAADGRHPAHPDRPNGGRHRQAQPARGHRRGGRGAALPFDDPRRAAVRTRRGSRLARCPCRARDRRARRPLAESPSHRRPGSPSTTPCCPRPSCRRRSQSRAAVPRLRRPHVAERRLALECDGRAEAPRRGRARAEKKRQTAWERLDLRIERVCGTT